MIDTFAFVLTGLGLAASLFYYARVLENANKTRQAALFSSLQKRMDEVEFRRIYRTIKYNHGDKMGKEMWDMFTENPNFIDEVYSVVSFFNHMGWLVQSGLLSLDAVIGNSLDVVSFYDITKPWLDEIEERTGYSQGYPPLTYLYNELKKHREAQN